MKGNLQSQKHRRRILLIDQQPLIAYGVQKLLKHSPTFELVGSVGNGLQALPGYRKFLPDIVMLDPEMPGMSGLDIILQLQQRDKLLKILLYTDSQDYIQLNHYIAEGVQAIVIKNQPVQNILDALHALCNQQPYLDPTLHPVELAGAAQTARVLGVPRLSPRERQILKLIAEGLRNRDISENFSISIKTVESHRLNLMRKLDAHHVVELVNWARKLQLI